MRDGNVCFLNYEVSADAIHGTFNELIEQYQSAEYKDLVVHCFLQTGLLKDEGVKTSEIRFRTLIPTPFSRVTPSPDPFPIDPNSPVTDYWTEYLEPEETVTMFKWEEVVIRNTSSIKPKLTTVEWLKHLHNLKKQEVNIDEDDDSAAPHPASEIILKKRIEQIKLQPA